MSITDHLYFYRAKVVSIYDADTVRLDIDLGCNIWIKNEPIRLYGINAYEVRGAERELGLAAKAFVEERMQAGDEVLLQTHKDGKGKYGRWLGIIWVNGVNLNDALVTAGHAKVNFYD